MTLQLITILNYLFCLLTIYFIVLILFVFQRHISILKLHLMIYVWNYQVIICSVLITLPLRKRRVCIYYNLNLPIKVLNTSNLDEVSTLRSVSLKRFATSSSSIDIEVKRRTSFKLLNEILK